MLFVLIWGGLIFAVYIIFCFWQKHVNLSSINEVLKEKSFFTMDLFVHGNNLTFIVCPDLSESFIDNNVVNNLKLTKLYDKHRITDLDGKTKNADVVSVCMWGKQFMNYTHKLVVVDLHSLPNLKCVNHKVHGILGNDFITKFNIDFFL